MRRLVRSWPSQWFSSRTTNVFTPVLVEESEEPVAKKMSKATYTPRLQGRVVEVHDRKPHGRTGPIEPSGKSGHFRSELCVVEKQDGRLLEVVSENGRRFKSRRIDDVDVPLRCAKALCKVGFYVILQNGQLVFRTQVRNSLLCTCEVHQDNLGVPKRLTVLIDDFL